MTSEALKQIERIMSDFLFFGQRLGDHERLRATLFWQSGSRLKVALALPTAAMWVPHIASAQSLVGAVITNQKPHFVAMREEDTISSARHPLDGIPRIANALAVPIPSEEGPARGAFCLYASEENFLGESAMAKAQLIAFIAGTLAGPPGSPKLRHILGQALMSVRQSIGITVPEAAQSLGMAVEAFMRLEDGWGGTFFAPMIREWLETLHLVGPRNHNRVQFVDVSQRILPLIARDPEILFQLSPKQFEELVAERLDRMGYSIQLTGHTNRKDGGIDIVAVPKQTGNFLLAAQVKHHKKSVKVPRSDVDRLLAWKDRFAMGMLVTTTGFSLDAQWLSEQTQHKNFLRLRGFDDLRKWISNDFKGEQREMPTEIELAPGVVVPIPQPVVPMIQPFTRE